MTLADGKLVLAPVLAISRRNNWLNCWGLDLCFRIASASWPFQLRIFLTTLPHEVLLQVDAGPCLAVRPLCCDSRDGHRVEFHSYHFSRRDLITGKMTVRPKVSLETDFSPAALISTELNSSENRSPPSKRFRLSLKGQSSLGSNTHSKKSKNSPPTGLIHLLKETYFIYYFRITRRDHFYTIKGCHH